MIIHITMDKAGMDEINLTMSQNAAAVLMQAIVDELMESDGPIRISISDVMVTEVVQSAPHYVHAPVGTMQ